MEGGQIVHVDLDIRKLFALLRKRWWIIALAAAIGTTAVALYTTKVAKPIYQASTKLIVNSASDIGGFKLDLNLINSNISLISTYKEIIRTPAIMNEVAERHAELGVTPEELARKIGFSSVNGTQVVTLTYADENYKKAAQIVNAVSSIFQQQIPGIMKVDNVYLLNKADETKQPAPFKPNKTLNMAAGFVLSLLLGIGIVLLLDFLDDTIKSTEDVADTLGLPTLVIVPKTRVGKRPSGHHNEASRRKKKGRDPYGVAASGRTTST